MVFRIVSEKYCVSALIVYEGNMFICSLYMLTIVKNEDNLSFLLPDATVSIKFCHTSSSLQNEPSHHQSSTTRSLLPSLHLTVLTTSWNNKAQTWYKYLKTAGHWRQIRIPANSYGHCVTHGLSTVFLNMTVVFGQWPFDVHLCFCFVRKH